MKTQRTKLVAKIALVLLVGMLELSLASCGSKNPLAGHTYENKEGYTAHFTEKMVLYNPDSDYPDEYPYKLDSDVLHGTIYVGSKEYGFTYSEGGTSVDLPDFGTGKKIK